MNKRKKLLSAIFAFALILVPLTIAQANADFLSGPIIVPPTPTPSPTPEPTPEPEPVWLMPEPTAYVPTYGYVEAPDADGAEWLNIDPERYLVQVDATNQVVTAFEQDENGKYTVIARQMICSTGKSSTPSPRGTYEMANEHYRFAYFAKEDVYAQYWSRITRNIYFHSVLYAEHNNTDSLIVDTFEDLGSPASNGCVRLMPQDAKWIYQNIQEGTTVKITRPKKNSKLTESLKPLYYVD